MKVLVTGATGTIGSSLVSQLATGKHHVTALQRSRDQCSSADATVFADVCEHNIVPHGTDVVIHCARALGGGANMERTNISGTVNILDECKRAGVKRFIYFSSTVVYAATNSNGKKVTEDLQLTQNSRTDRYTLHKIRNEQQVRDFCSEHGIKYLIFRLSCASGVAPNGRVSSIVRGLWTMLKWRVSLAWQSINIIHVKDIAEIVSRLVESPDAVYDETYNLTGHRVRLADVFRKRWCLPLPLPDSLGDLLPSSASTLFKPVNLSNEKLLRAVQYELRHTSADNMLPPVPKFIPYYFYIWILPRLLVIHNLCEFIGWRLYRYVTRVRREPDPNRVKGIAVAILTTGNGHLLQAIEVIGCVKRRYPHLPINAIVVGDDAPEFFVERLKKQCPDATVYFKPNLFQMESARSFLAWVYYIISQFDLFKQAYFWHTTIHDQYNIGLIINFMDPMAVYPLMVSGSNTRQVVSLGSHFSFWEERNFGSIICESHLEGMMIPRRANFIAFDYQPNQGSIPQTLDKRVENFDVRLGEHIMCYGCFTPTFRVITTIPTHIPVILYAKENELWAKEFAANKNITVKPLGDSFVEDFASARAVISLPSRGTPSLCLRYSKPCFILTAHLKWHYEQNTNYRVFAEKYPEVFTTEATKSLREWALELGPIKQTPNTRATMDWLRQESFDAAVYDGLEPYLAQILLSRGPLQLAPSMPTAQVNHIQRWMKDHATFEANDGFVAVKNFFSKEELSALGEDLQLSQLPRKHLTYVKPKLYTKGSFMTAVSRVIGTSIKGCHRRDRNKAWLLYYRPVFDHSFHATEKPHYDIPRYKGRQFQVMIPLILDEPGSLRYQPKGQAWQEVQYALGDMYIVEAGRSRHHHTLSTNKMLLCMDFVEVPDKLRPLHLLMTQYFQNISLSMDMATDAIIPQTAEMEKSKVLTTAVAPHCKDICPALYSRLVQTPVTLQRTAEHQSRKAVAHALGVRPRPKRYIISSYSLRLPETELQDIAQEMRHNLPPDIEVLTGQSFIRRWDERAFVGLLRMFRPAAPLLSFVLQQRFYTQRGWIFICVLSLFVWIFFL